MPDNADTGSTYRDQWESAAGVLRAHADKFDEQARQAPYRSAVGCAIKDCPDPGVNRVRYEDDETEYWFCDRHVVAYCEPREP